MGAMAHAKKYFGAFLEDNGNDVEQAMALLAMQPSTRCYPYSWLYAADRWGDLANQFQLDCHQMHGLSEQSQLMTILRAGLAALHTPKCASGGPSAVIDCPVCVGPISNLARFLPIAHHEASAVFCRITGEPMDADNPPMALTNGQVYSARGLQSIIDREGRVVCPISGTFFKFADAKKCFIL